MEKDEEDFDFEEAYEKLKVKHDLPDFLNICEDFDIEKVADKESKFLIREIRRVVAEKTTAYLHLFETLINPSAPPMFVFSILREVSEKDRETMKDIYKELSKLQIKIMKLDAVYDENDEVTFVKFTYKIWQDIKVKILKIINNFELNFENNTPIKKSNYFD